MSIGRRNDNNYSFNGNLAQNLIYKRVLSATEISNLYQYGQIPASPVRQYNLTEGSQAVAYDLGSDASNGTIQLRLVEYMLVTLSLLKKLP